ncbi:cell division protein ZapA [Salinicoccus sp. HZC-1]|uniref:cell division protein ZapA n=1 Tax=Salinicoccus sp. HZC-1 TaxID=3385497 RepID=UPI00398A887A
MAEYKNRIAVDIYDQQYTLVGTEDPEHMRYVAGLVDEKIREIGVRNAGLDTTRKAVLSAVNVMDDYVKLQEKYDSLVQELEQKDN